jgi:two-component system chemotaxis response regulator CheY
LKFLTHNIAKNVIHNDFKTSCYFFPLHTRIHYIFFISKIMEQSRTGLTKDGMKIVQDHYKALKNDTPVPLNAIVIDDNFDIVELFCEFLEMQGIKIVGRGYNGKDAEDLYEKSRPDVVFLDIMMPDYDGFYALDNIRRINPRAKVMMVTADLRKETADKLDTYDSISLVYKPFDFDNIMKQLDILMQPTNVDGMAFQGSTISMLKKQ